MTSRTRHVVWDWNGTLLDDFEITARIAIDSLAELGFSGITGDDLRDSCVRPFTEYYRRLMGRPPTSDELRYLSDSYFSEYETQMFGLSLAPDAEESLQQVSRCGSQSLLSMAPDDQLHQLVDHHELRGWFELVEGSRGSNAGTKGDALEAHLQTLGVPPSQTVVIGDTLDDHDAAIDCGAASILVTTGMQSRGGLEQAGVAVVDTLLQAVRLAMAHKAL